MTNEQNRISFIGRLFSTVSTSVSRLSQNQQALQTSSSKNTVRSSLSNPDQFIAASSTSENNRDTELNSILNQLSPERRREFNESLRILKEQIGALPKGEERAAEERNLPRVVRELARIYLERETNIRSLRKYINRHGRSFSGALPNLIRNHQFVLVGETHFDDDSSNIGRELVRQLPRLAREARRRGENLIVAVEIDRSDQNLLEQAAKGCRKSERELRELYRGHAVDVALAARRAGLRVICADLHPDCHPIDRSRPDPDNLGHGRPGLALRGQLAEQQRRYEESLEPTGPWPLTARREREDAQRRDDGMYNLLTEVAQPRTRVIFYGGSTHTSESPALSTRGPVDTLGARLRNRFGDRNVASIRSVDHHFGFDGELLDPSFEDRSRLPSPSDVLPGRRNLILVPEGGLIRSQRSSHDYVVIDPSPALQR